MKNVEDVEVSIYTPDDINIEACRGCTTCFCGNECVLDKKDNFGFIKKKMLEADIIILASPVYASTISGDLKIFIDRISYLIHLMALRGKIGIPILTTSNNSLIETNEYLDKIINYLGAAVPFSILCSVDYPKQFESIEFRRKIIPQYAQRTVALYRGEEQYVVKRIQEVYFQKMKKFYNSKDKKTSEALYWEENGMLKYNTYQELLGDIKSGRT